MLFNTLIEENDPKAPFFHVYWAHAAHLGAALEKIYLAAIKNGLKNPVWRTADPITVDDLPSELNLIKSNEVFWAKSKYCFPPETIMKSMTLPYGVINSRIKGEFDADEIKQGFNIYKQDNLHYLDVNISDIELAPLYFDILNEYKSFECFW